MSAVSHLLAAGAFPSEADVKHYGITGALFMKKLPSLDVLKDSLIQDILPYKRMRSIPVGWYWREVEVNVDEHLIDLQVKNGSDMRRKIEEIANQPFDHSKPRWQIIRIFNMSLANEERLAVPVPHLQLSSSSGESSETDGEKYLCGKHHVMLLRVDHCIGDGVSIVEVFSKLLTDLKGRALNRTEGLIGLKRRDAWRTKRMYRWESRKLAGITERSIIDVIRLVSWVKHRIVTPAWKLVNGMPRFAWAAFGLYDSGTPTSAPLHVKKRGIVFCSDQKLAMSRPWSLSFVKKIRREADVSINDVMMSCFAGALRRYNMKFSTASEVHSSVRCRALVPFAFLRPPQSYDGSESALRNDWVMVSATFCTNEPTPVERLMATQRETRALKNRMQALANNVFTKLTTWLNRQLSRRGCWDLYSRHSFIFANVPGPPVKARYCGEVIDHIQVFFCNTLPQVEILSYANKIYLNVVADSSIIAYPSLLVQFFHEELRALGKALGVEGPVFAQEEQEDEDHSSFSSSASTADSPSAK